MRSLDAALIDAAGAPPSPLRVDSPPRPLGFGATFGWIAGAFAGAFLAMLVTAAAFTAWTGVGWSMPVALIGFMLVFFGTIVLACRQRGWRAGDYLALTMPQGRFLRLSAVGLLVPWTMAAILSQFGDLGGDDSAPATINDLFIMAIGAVIFAPIGEELLFRGFLYRGLAASRLGVAGAIALTALIWAGLHIDRTWLGFVEVFFCGLVWGWLRWRTGSTVSTIAVHAPNNAIAVSAIAGETLGWWT
jgi:uncharacterized protein